MQEAEGLLSGAWAPTSSSMLLGWREEAASQRVSKGGPPWQLAHGRAGWTDMAPVQESNRAGESGAEGMVGRKLQTMAQTHQDTRGAMCCQGLLKESHQRTPREAQPEDMSSSGR